MFQMEAVPQRSLPHPPTLPPPNSPIPQLPPEQSSPVDTDCRHVPDGSRPTKNVENDKRFVQRRWFSPLCTEDATQLVNQSRIKRPKTFLYFSNRIPGQSENKTVQQKIVCVQTQCRSS